MPAGFALGGIRPASGYGLDGTQVGDDPNGVQSNDPVRLLQSIDRSLKVLKGRLVPQPLMQQVVLNGLAIGGSLNPQNLYSPTFNAVIAYITAGLINVYKGPSGGQPFLVFPASSGPIYLPFSPQDTTQVTIQNDPTATEAAQGFLYFVSY